MDHRYLDYECDELRPFTKAPKSTRVIAFVSALLASSVLSSGSAATSARPFDFNGDGNVDLVFSAPRAPVGTIPRAGRVHVLFSNSRGATTADQLLSQATTAGKSAPQDGGAFGASTASADFDKDGFADLVVGSPGHDAGEMQDVGEVVLFYGSSNGLSTTRVQVWEGDVPGQRESLEGGQLGWSLATGDWNGDGKADLAVGAPQSTVGTGPNVGGAVGSHPGAGMTLVVYGTGAGVFTGALSTRFQQWDQDQPGVEGFADSDPYSAGGQMSYERFGASLSTGDFDGDSFDDLVVGVSGEAARVWEGGAIQVFYGTQSGLTADRDQLWDQDSEGIKDQTESRDGSDFEGSGEFGDHFGAVTAAGDFDGDGYDDVAVGIPDEQVWPQGTDNTFLQGAVAVLYGSRAGVSARDQFWHQDSPSVPGTLEGAGDQFGAALAAGDFNADGRDDLAIGAPGEELGDLEGTGLIEILFGRSGGLSGSGSQAFNQEKSGVPGEPERNDRFGFTLRALNLGRGSYSDLIVGVPGESVGSKAGAGLVEVFYGASSGLSSLGIQAFSADTAGIKGAATADAGLGFVSSTFRAEDLVYRHETV